MCPKCKTGSLSPTGINSSNWRCSVCGYTEYRPSPSVDTSSSRQRTNSAMSGFNSASNDVDRALRAQNAAMREHENERRTKDKGGKGGWLVVVIAAIVVYMLLNS